MKLLILTQYFPPEVGAPQNRLLELAVRLKDKGDDVKVLTAMPNYPQMKGHAGYKGKFYMYEEMNGLKVPKNVEATAMALERLILNPTHRESIGKNVREKVILNYSLENMVIQMIELYKHLR